MPHLDRAERIHLRMILVAALNQIRVEATEAIEMVAEDVINNDDPEPERLEDLWAMVADRRARLDNLTASLQAVRLAEQSLT